jgi:hypothetical protein
LVPDSYWEDLDNPLSHVFAKMMVAFIDMLGTRTKLWKPSKFQCTRIIFKNLAVLCIGLCTDGFKTLLANFLNQKHHRKYVL